MDIGVRTVDVKIGNTIRFSSKFARTKTRCFPHWKLPVGRVYSVFYGMAARSNFIDVFHDFLFWNHDKI